MVRIEIDKNNERKEIRQRDKGRGKEKFNIDKRLRNEVQTHGRDSIKRVLMIRITSIPSLTALWTKFPVVQREACILPLRCFFPA